MNRGQEWEELDTVQSVGCLEGFLLALPVQHPIFLRGNLRSPSLHPRGLSTADSTPPQLQGMCMQSKPGQQGCTIVLASENQP